MFKRLFAPGHKRAVPGPSQDQPGPVGPPAPLDAFVVWLTEAKQTDNLDRRALVLLYGEFCLDTHTEHLTEGQLLRRIRRPGIERYREPVGKRRWRYRVRPRNHGR